METNKVRLNLPLGGIPAVLLTELQTGSDVTAPEQRHQALMGSLVCTRITLSRSSSDKTPQLEFSAFSLEFSFFFHFLFATGTSKKTATCVLITKYLQRDDELREEMIGRLPISTRY